VAATGGGKQGVVKEYPSLDGYFFLRKPDDFRVLFKLPLVLSTALDMVSGSKGWKLYIPIEKKAMEGTTQIPDPSQHGLESLRPVVIFDSLLVRGVRPGEIVAQTSGSRVIPSDTNKKQLIEEPVYHLAILAQPQGQSARTLRVIHISRANMLPYQQDIYDDQGKIATEATYSNYRKFGNTEFPTKIVVERPNDQYSLSLTITNIIPDQKFDEDQFELKIPDNVPIRNMDLPSPEQPVKSATK
jgi:Outer membrane lipoprotein-sorting protein